MREPSIPCLVLGVLPKYAVRVEFDMSSAGTLEHSTDRSYPFLFYRLMIGNLTTGCMTISIKRHTPMESDSS